MGGLENLGVAGEAPRLTTLFVQHSAISESDREKFFEFFETTGAQPPY
jgi:hypothetical protein